MKIRLPVLALFLALLVPAYGEAPAHNVLVHYAGPQSDKYLPSLTALLAREPLSLWTVASALPAQAGAAELAKEAHRFASDLILTVNITAADGKDEVSWTLASPQEPGPRAQGHQTKNRPDWPAAAELYWLFLVSPLAKELGPGSLPWPEPAVSERAAFTVSARPGTLVQGLPGGAVTVGPAGSVKVDLNLPVSVYLEGHLVGVKTRAVRVFVDHAGQELTLDQTPEPEWALTPHLDNFAFPGLGVEWSPGAGRLVVRGGLEQYLGGLLFQNRADAGSGAWPVQSLPLAELSLGASWIWSWPEDAVRFYTAADVSVRFMFPQFKVFTVEPVVPMTFTPLVGWEYRWADHQAAFFEMGPTFLWIPDQALYLASLSPHSQNLNILLPAVPFAVSFPLQAKVGYRWSF